MRFKLKEGKHKNSFESDIEFNCACIESVGRLTFGINDDEVCVKNCQRL